MYYVEELLDAIFPFVEELLVKNGEFYPVAAAIKTDDQVAMVGSWDGNDNPLSEDVIKSLKAGLREGAVNGKYKAAAILYDVTVTDNETKEKQNAIAALVENNIDAEAFTLYYVYQLTDDNELEYGESWRSEKEKEIFID